MPSLTQTTAKGLIWLLGQSAAFRLINLATQIVLARILFWEDFAVLALASTVTAIFGIMQNFGIEDFLVQRQRKMQYWRKPALLMALGLGTATMLLIIAVSPFAARMYGSPKIMPMLMIMSLGMPLSALSTVAAAELRTSLKFGFLAGYNTADQLVSQILTIVLAFTGFGPFSFAIPGPISAVVRAVVYWKIASGSYKKLKRRQLRIIGNKGLTLFGTKMINALIGQGDYFILGLTVTKAEVGAYYFAYRLAFQPIAALAGNFKSVLVPGLIQFQGDLKKQRDIAFEAAEMLSFTIMPLSILIACVAPFAFPLVFGHKWDASIVLVQILSVALAFDAVAWIAGGLLDAQGKFNTGFKIAAAMAPLFFICVFTGAKTFSTVGASWGVFVYYLINGPVYYFVVFKKLGTPTSKVLKVCFVPAVLSFVSIIIPTIAIESATFPGVVKLVLISFTGPIFYVSGLKVFCSDVCTLFLGRLRKLLTRQRF